MRPGLPQSLINTPQHEAANHALFVDDDATCGGKIFLHVQQPRSVQLNLPAVPCAPLAPLNIDPHQFVHSFAADKRPSSRVGKGTHLNALPVSRLNLRLIQHGLYQERFACTCAATDVNKVTSGTRLLAHDTLLKPVIHLALFRIQRAHLIRLCPF